MKKNVLMILAAVFVVVVLAGMLVFVFSGDTSAQDASVSLNPQGTWKVAAYIQAGTTTLPEGEFFTFTADSAEAFRGGVSIARSAYTLTPGTYPNVELSLPDISRKYTAVAFTDNYIRLYESSSVYMELIRYGNTDLSDVIMEQAALEGSWTVAYRNTDENIVEEKMVFAGGMLEDYRNGIAEAYAVVPYYWDEEGRLCVDALAKKMICYPCGENILFLQEHDTGLIWELNKGA